MPADEIVITTEHITVEVTGEDTLDVIVIETVETVVVDVGAEQGPAGPPGADGAEQMAEHLIQLDPHNQYQLKNELSEAFRLPPLEDGLWVLRVTGGVATWEILNLSF